MDNVAVYWDFENIHASLCQVKFGENWYKQNRYQKQPEAVDIDAIMEYINTLGNININKAYANWGFFFPYNFDLQNHAIDLVQLFPRGAHGKNGADIRMAIDIIEDLGQNTHIGVVVAIGGDSDYISIAQKVRQKGKRIVGIGVKEATNQYWIRTCNEFKFYASLIIKASSPTVQPLVENFHTESLDEAKELLCRAVAALSSNIVGGPVVKAAVKPMMTRLDSSFDEANYGYRSFTSFLEACGDVVSVSQGQYDHMVSVKNESPSSCVIPERKLGTYESILKKQQVRLVPPKLMESGIREAFDIFSQKGEVGSYMEFKNELMQRLHEKGLSITDTDASKLKAILFKVFAFRLAPDRNGISLSDNIRSAEDLLLLVRQTLVKRIFNNIDGEVDSNELSMLLYGDEGHMEEVENLIKAYAKAEKDRRSDA